MRIKVSIMFLLVSAVFIMSCSVCKNDSAEVMLKADTESMEVWLNVMPGGPPSFHFAGKIVVTNTSGGKIDDLDFSSVVFESGDKLIYEVAPEFKEDPGTLNTDEVKTIEFYAPQNLPVKPELKDIDSLNVVYVFTINGSKQNIKAGYYPLVRAY